MMSGIQSENLLREWKDDPHAPELWDSLQQMDTDPAAGALSLKALAKAGSALAMMHLGHIYLSGQFGVVIDKALGEAWLRRSSECGSIEGGYRLANILLADDRAKEALGLFAELSERGYSPATCVLGLETYRGNRLERSIPKALEYFEASAAQGHLLARHWKSTILIRECHNIFSWIHGWVIRFSMIPSMVNLKLNRPRSDRLRIWI